MHAITHGGARTCRTGESNLRPRCASPMLYQLSYIPAYIKFSSTDTCTLGSFDSGNEIPGTDSGESSADDMTEGSSRALSVVSASGQRPGPRPPVLQGLTLRGGRRTNAHRTNAHQTNAHRTYAHRKRS